MSHGAKAKTPLQKWFDLDEWIDWMNEWKLSRAFFLAMLFAGLLSVLSLLIEDLPRFAFWWIVGTAPVWLPIALMRGSWHAWIEYIREEFLAKQKKMLLEVRIPRDITKSPRAMELVFNHFYSKSGEVTFIQRCWLGSVRQWYSWEIASFGGEIHFYTWCWAKHRNFLETAIYAQYPEVEIFEVEDYATRFVYDPKKHSAFVTNYVLEPRGDEYPIKSYIDYELDKDPKEELKVDPLAGVFETLGSIKPTEQMWIQILVRAAGKETGHHALNPGNSKDKWEKRIKQAVEDIRKEASKSPVQKGEEVEYMTTPRPSWRQQKAMETLERHLGKLPYEVGLRGIYLAEGAVDGSTRGAFRWIWKPFSNPAYMNTLRPSDPHGHSVFDFPWQDFRNYRWELMTRRWLDAYRERSFFYTPYAFDPIIMTPETLATIYHYPSRTIATPGIQRIPSTKAEPPPNLPR